MANMKVMKYRQGQSALKPHNPDAILPHNMTKMLKI